jgi:DNA-binding LytR/AlgR family response regulator
MLKTPSGVMKIKFVDFIFAETDKHLQLIYLTDGRCIQVRMKSFELFEFLCFDQRFYKCGSTYIINMGKIEEVTKTDIIFDNGDRIPMQRRQYKELIDRYTAYSLEGN